MIDLKLKNTIEILTTHLNGQINGHGYATSSFQTQSVVLLHILSLNFPEVKIVFIDTGYLFAETYAYKNELEARYKLNIITLRSELSYLSQISSQSGLPLYSEDTNRCCHINKVIPIDKFLRKGDIWISGVRKDQTNTRAQMDSVEEDNKGIIRVHPMLEWTGKDVYTYINQHNLPKHPLDEKGYQSIGCVPCTQKWDGINVRSARWAGSKKTECGLHMANKSI